jgi:CheY-like chemotaxis protein
MLHRDNEVALGWSMGSATLLQARSILVVEDDALITLELSSLFESAGAQVIAARTRQEALIAIEQYQICAALLDYGLGEDSVAPLCGLLSDYRIPYMFYTGYSDLGQSYPHAVIVQKPASGEVLLATMADLIARDPVDWVDRTTNARRRPQPEALRREGQTELAAD